jgi:uncharacterized protein (TIGR04255 family)
MARAKYRRDPIAEALCEFRFVGGATWGQTTQATLHEALREAYPEAVEVQQILSAQIRFSQGGPEMTPGDTTDRVKFSDGRGRVTFAGPGVLSVHALSPYPGWETLRDAISLAFSAYRRVMSPTGLARIGVRYINRFEVGADVAPARMLACAPRPRTEASAALVTHSLREEYLLESGETLVVSSASAADGGLRSLVLDLDVIRVWPGGDGPLEDGMAVVDRLHDVEGVEFERVITEQAKGVFDAE